MFLIWSSWSFSQSIPDKIEIKKTTLISIVKESRKCDSLKIAYNLKSLQLTNLINSNLMMFQELEEQRIKRIEAEKNLQKNIKIYKKKNNKNVVIFATGGALLGILAGVLISN